MTTADEPIQPRPPAPEEPEATTAPPRVLGPEATRPHAPEPAAPGRSTSRRGTHSAAAPTVPWAAFCLDVLLVILFATIGRLSHAEGVTLGGLITTASPFLAGTVGAWAVLSARGRLRPATLPAGVLIWAATLVVGMLLRAITGQGVAVSFVIVAGVVTALFLIGWRAAGQWLIRRAAT